MEKIREFQKSIQFCFIDYAKTFDCVDNNELPDDQAGFRKSRGARDQIANICWIIEKAGEFQRTSTSALLTMPEPLTVWITINCGKFLKRWEFQTTLPPS